MNVRVRGIYTTAITKILLDEGINVTYTSQIIRNRFRINDSQIAPNVTIKDTDNKYGILIIGEYEAGNKIFNLLIEKIRGRTFTWCSKLPLHSIIKGKVKNIISNKVIVNFGDIEGILSSNNYYNDDIKNKDIKVGDEIVVEVLKPILPPSNDAIFSTRFMIYGKYVTLIYGLKGKITFSRHITNPERKNNLKMIVSLMKLGGEWGVKWRSSATIGNINDLMSDLQETYERANKIIKSFDNYDVGEIIYKGQFFGIIGLDNSAKRNLDNIRNKVTPTINNHHSIKSINNNLTNVIDYTEYLIGKGYISREKASSSIINYIGESLKSDKLINIEHISILNPKIKRLTPGKTQFIKIQDNILYGALKRQLRGGGTLDGLDIPKSAGDYDIMEFSTDTPLIIHKYYSRDNKLKGIYININSEPEISVDTIRYFDLEVDLIMYPDGTTKIIDIEKLELARKESIITEKLYMEIIRLINILNKIIKENIDNMKLNKISIENLKKMGLLDATNYELNLPL